jgi:cobalt-zinc-cadmium efflux system outer membrane protein
MSRKSLAIILALGLLLGGCATVSTEGAAGDVQKIAADRLNGKEARWSRSGTDDAAIDETVRHLLEAPLTVDSAAQIALLNNKHLQASYEELGIAQADLVQAGLLSNPSFSSQILVGNDAVSPSFTLVQDFFSILTRSARQTVASSAVERAKYDLGHELLSTAAEVRSAYYTAMSDEQAVAVLRQVVSSTEAAAELAHRQLLAGNVNPRDQMVLQAQYGRATLELARAEAQSIADRERLNRLLGLFGDQTGWNLPGNLLEVPKQKLAFEGLEKLAIERRLDLAGARQDVETATYALDLGRQTRWLSTLGLGIVVERDPDNHKWLKGPEIEFSLPLFDQGEARVASLEAQQRRSQKKFVALAVDVRSEVREAWARLGAAQDTVAFYRSTVLPLQRRVVAENQRLYNGMLIGVYDLLKSRQDEIAAARDYISAVRDYWIAHSELERALAGPLPGTTHDAAIPRDLHKPIIAGVRP